MHFTIEHNFGHHARVGTNEDPATSRYGENIFAFHWRSITQGWLSAWRIKSAQLSRMKTPLPVLQNTVLWYLVIQTAYVLVLYLVFGSQVAIGLSLAGVLGILLLETINYVEHYGLIRQKEANGRYAHVASFHSWNSDHQAGRILLYELTRHSDHHYKAHKKYQLLDHHGESPQLPFGYPASILLALVPPLWFTVMNPRVEAWQLKYGRA
jgi:alkane 1-monooxygenase